MRANKPPLLVGVAQVARMVVSKESILVRRITGWHSTAWHAVDKNRNNPLFDFDLIVR